MPGLRWFLRSKIHRATVTDADIDYVGSISIDANLLSSSGISHWERVQVVDLTNGARIETYAIEDEPGSGRIQINGAAAHLIKPGNKIIIMTYMGLKNQEIDAHEPKIIHLDDQNKIFSPSD
ncbi:MAG: aspartate 1-decarboxylase [Euryarchaeota archaeon]|nr:aspartate 1-decarboxylase [Euryarchaeota archaeon]OUW22988.1 MAG: aspartate 1-decarboxylase [Euryarchaeota archaeon TMED173]|tara:strand:- start:89 stop:454 length:366 start_codon:yes stop_codon:yes gene_type:complete